MGCNPGRFIHATTERIHLCNALALVSNYIMIAHHRQPSSSRILWRKCDFFIEGVHTFFHLAISSYTFQ
jgi:hypothetical protein